MDRHHTTQQQPKAHLRLSVASRLASVTTSCRISPVNKYKVFYVLPSPKKLSVPLYFSAGVCLLFYEGFFTFCRVKKESAHDRPVGRSATKGENVLFSIWPRIPPFRSPT